MKTLVLYIALSIATISVFAQQPGSKDMIEAAKIGFISEKLNLNPKQAQTFWPLYNEYQQKRKEIRKTSNKIKFDNNEEQNDIAAIEDINKIIQLKQKELDLEKEYLDKFLKVISANQVVMLYRAEKEFSKILLQKLKENKKGKN